MKIRHNITIESNCVAEINISINPKNQCTGQIDSLGEKIQDVLLRTIQSSSSIISNEESSQTGASKEHQKSVSQSD